MYRGGYVGKVLRIDLTKQDFRVEELPLSMATEFIGGAGFGIKYLFDEVKAGTDPLGPDNKLIFASGPFSGTTITSARGEMTKSMRESHIIPMFSQLGTPGPWGKPDLYHPPKPASAPWPARRACFSSGIFISLKESERWDKLCYL